MPRLTFVCSALLLLAFPLTAAADEFRAGVAVTDITPPVPYRMCGYFEERVSTGVKDPLLAKAVVFEQGDTSAALVFCDLIGVPREISAAARLPATPVPMAAYSLCRTYTPRGSADPHDVESGSEVEANLDLPPI